MASFARHTLFKTLFDRHRKLSPRNPRNVALVMLMARQVVSAHGVLVLAQAGRPSLATALLRGMYETHLNILAIGFYRGMMGKKKPLKVTPSYLARRFLAFSVHLQRRSIEEIERDVVDTWVKQGQDRKDAEKRRAAIMRRAQLARTRYGFSAKTSNWHGFGGTEALFLALWPKGGRPAVPPKLIGPEKEWQMFFDYAYRLGSHHVHGNAYALMELTRFDPEQSALVKDTPHYDTNVLKQADGFLNLSVAASARALNALTIWNRAASSLPAIPKVEATRFHSRQLGIALGGWRRLAARPDRKGG